MKNLRILLLIGCLVYLGAFLAPKAKADEWNQKTILTFDQPVELPGNVVLPAGTYIFKLLGSLTDRNLVQVLSQDEQKVYATIHAIPAYREHATDGTLIVLQDTTAGAPRAIKEWFFPDRRYGHEFVYSKAELVNLAKANEPEVAEHSEQTGQSEENSYPQPPDWTEPVELAKTDEPENANKPAESAEPQPTEVRSMKNEPASVEHSEQTMPPPQPELEAEAQQPPQAAMARELPKTASLLPLTGLIGMLLVAGAFGLRLYSGKID